MDSKDKKQLAKKRKEAAKQAQKFHREQDKQEKQNKKASQKILKANSAASKKGEDVTSKIKEAVSARRDKRQAERRSNLSREEKFRRDGKEKIRNLRPQDHEDGYYVDEYAEKQRQERRAKVIRRQERGKLFRCFLCVSADRVIYNYPFHGICPFFNISNKYIILIYYIMKKSRSRATAIMTASRS